MVTFARHVFLLLALGAATWFGIARARSSQVSEADTSFASFAPSGRLGDPIPNLEPAMRARFDRGRAVAMRRFSPSTGLGPAYNAVSCRNCHEKPVAGGGASRYRGVSIAITPKPSFVVPFEKRFTTTSVVQTTAKTSATHVPSPFFGIGLLAEIPTQEIVRRADPNDANHDGISGRVSFERGFVGRFGRKAQMSSLVGFVRLALLDHMGITSAQIAMPQGVLRGEIDVPVEMPTRDDDAVPDGELSAADLEDLVTFVALLAPPAPEPPNAQTALGRKTFETIGCASCHVPALRGPRGLVPAFTDLLLHDMGPELADGVRVGEASGSEYRTSPLWGVAAGGPYLHDGRAASLDEAIRAHGGEAAAARSRYVGAGEEDRAALVAFLRSLGGREHASEGLLPPGAEVPPVGAAGGPRATLSSSERATFVRGRAIFDRDFSVDAGLGPLFNGDACRSCHFDPVIGGAGPADVDAVRHGHVDLLGKFIAPAGGETLARHFSTKGTRPERDGRANLFERRQTPSLLGLGLVDEIDEAAILLGADPSDRDGDGVRGVVSVLDDGRIGRFGWRAQIATLRDFIDDAFAGEMGIDATEVGGDVREDLTSFVRSLAAPAARTNATTEAMTAFSQLGCASCHTPSLPTKRGERVELFSDLLLHDVASTQERFVAQGSAARGFRTPPLWGVSKTAPYWHDGSADTIDAAIRKHDGEARRSRVAYESASATSREAVLTLLAR